MTAKDFTRMLIDILEEYRALEDSPLRDIISLQTEKTAVSVTLDDGSWFQIHVAQD